MLNVPVLFVIFNRPDPTRQVFEAIRKASPKQLFIAADGPRPGKEEEEKCKEAREVLNQIDWECEVYTLFREQNLGCKRAVSSAIDWFFGHVAEGIILEDDCLPDHSFFQFCEELLVKYRSDERIMMICGNNALSSWDTPYSYQLSRIGAIWGWASWRRAWRKYDVTMADWPQAKKEGVLSKSFKDKDKAAYREMICERTFQGIIDSWAYPWTFARIKESGLSIVSSVNLIKNIGFGEDATHTTSSTNILSDQTLLPMKFPLVHPVFTVIDEDFDDAVYNKTIGFKLKRSIKERIKSLLNAPS